MRFLFLLLFSISFIMVGCTGGLDESDSAEGYVLKKNEDGILVARNISQEKYNEIKDVSDDELIHQNGLSLIWLSYEKADAFQKGDHVMFWIKGEIRESYPEQADALKIERK